MKHWPAWITNTILVTSLLVAVTIVYCASRPTFKACVSACVVARGDASLGRCQAACFFR